MSFSIDRYKEESRKLDTLGIDWDGVSNHPLSKGDLFCLHYMLDIENHERRHFAFYYNSAKKWLLGNRFAQRIGRLALERVWVPVGQGVKNQEEVDALALYLFDDEEGEADLARIDEKIGKLPGLQGIELMSRALKEARGRVARTPRWGRRLIQNEEWAAARARFTPVVELTGRRADAVFEAVNS